jgi:hypothetical protein
MEAVHTCGLVQETVGPCVFFTCELARVSTDGLLTVRPIVGATKKFDVKPHVAKRVQRRKRFKKLNLLLFGALQLKYHAMLRLGILGSLAQSLDPASHVVKFVLQALPVGAFVCVLGHRFQPSSATLGARQPPGQEPLREFPRCGET